MIRRPTLLLAAIGVIAIARPALAKPKVAVLGIEVVDDGGNMAASTTLRAKNLTDRLRDQPQRPSGKYELAPNSNKDLLEMKLLSNCSDEGHACMADIGRELKADKLIYGKIERQKSGFLVSLKLLDVASAGLDKTSRRRIGFDDSSREKLANHASALYRSLTGEPELGTIAVRVRNTEKGTVYLDGEIRTSLAAGSATLRDVPEGAHTLAIEAEGYRMYSREVSVGRGKTESVELSLKHSSAGGGGRPGGGYRKLAWVSGALTIGSAAGLTWFGTQVWKTEDKKNELFDTVDASGGSREAMFKAVVPEGVDDACKPAQDARAGGESNTDVLELADICDDGQHNRDLVNYAFIPATVVTGLATAFFVYKGYIAGNSSENESTVARRKKKRAPIVSVEPVIGPTGAMTSLKIEF